MILHAQIAPRWQGEACIIAATGPSLTPQVAERCRIAHAAGHYRAIAVNDAHRLMPWADVLYSCDAGWWQYHKGVPGFAGERWSSHALINPKTGKPHDTDNKAYVAKEFGLNLVHGKAEAGFSLDPKHIHYGSNSGFQALNLALLFGATRIVLVGYNMQPLEGVTHFFGEHPREIRRGPRYAAFVPHFQQAARLLGPDIDIVNATPNSALTCFPTAALEDAL